MRIKLLCALTCFAFLGVPLSRAAENLICRLANPAQAGEVAASYGLTLTDTTSPAPFALYLCPPGTTANFYQAAMVGDPRIIWAEDDGTLEPPEKQSSKGSVGNVIADRTYLAAENTGFLQQIGFPGPRSGGYRPVRVAILDTGLSPNVPRLWVRVVATLNAVPDNNGVNDLPTNLDSNGNGVPDDGAGHGTMVTGLIDLMAPDVDLVIARVADSDGVATAWAVIKGLAFAAVQGAEVANVSLGAIDRLPALSDVLDWTDEVGLLVIAPAGNGNVGEVLFPAGYSKTVCVTGVDALDKKAAFSNWGGDADLAAPAVGIRSAWYNGMTAVWSGTSFAAPMVSAAVSDALRRSPSRFVPGVLRDRIALGGDDIDPLNPAYSGELGRRLKIKWMEYSINRNGSRK